MQDGCPGMPAAAQVVQAFRGEAAFAKFAEWVREPDLDAIREAQAAGQRKPRRKRKAALSDEASDAGAPSLLQRPCSGAASLVMAG